MSHPTVYIGNGCIVLAVGCALLGMIAFFASRKVEVIPGARVAPSTGKAGGASPSTPLRGCGTASTTAAALGRAMVYATFILMTIANLAMIRALLTNDFSVSYVAHVGSRATPRWISAISLWSSLEGSILFWGWVLTAYSAICVYVYRAREARLMTWVGLTVLAIQCFFFILLAMPANPFLPVAMIPMDGPGPNPLLQNHWLMAIHPPFLYIGYIGFTIPFAFAVAALMESPARRSLGEGGDVSGAWIGMTRRWTLFAWSFLSMAIVLGGWWSYAVLGWGGYWAWDPVENASFMPWLSATALVHSVMVQEKRKMLPVWNLTLAIITFLLTLLGTFLTRSGVLESVHSFTESAIGPYFLFFICTVLAISVALLLWRASSFREPGKVEHLFSLEVLFLFNNLLFISFCFIVFLGTMYPLIVEAVGGKRISVGQPYFNQMTVPIVGMILLLMGMALVTPWRKGNPKAMAGASRLPALLALVTTAIAALAGAHHAIVLLMIFLAAFAGFVMGVEFAKVTWNHGGRFWQPFIDNPRRYGGFISHFGALLIVVAVAISATYKNEREITLQRGASATLGAYTVTLEGVEAADQPQRFEVRAVVGVSRGGKSLGTLHPQMNFYRNSRDPIATPSIRSTLIADLYLAPIHFEKDGSTAAMRAIVQPAVAWIWIGGLLVMAGGLLALSLGQRRG